MSSSTFEVKESESDSEKVLDFELDACEENGIMSTQLDGELPKDHTYTKDPEWVQDDNAKEDGDVSNNQPEDAIIKAESPTSHTGRASRSGRASVQKASVKASKTKKAVSAKAKGPKKLKRKKEEPTGETDVASQGATDDTETKSPEKLDTAPKEEKPNSPKRGRKRKTEEKENVLEQKRNGQVNSLPAKRKPTKSSSPAKPSQVNKEKSPAKRKSTAQELITSGVNLPKGWVRKIVMRKSGRSAGKFDVYIYSPDGVKFRSKPDLAGYLLRTKSTLKLDSFDFSKKLFIGDAPIEAKVPAKKEAPTKKGKKLLVTDNDTSNKKKSPVKKVNKTLVKGKKGTKATSKSSTKKKA